MSARTLIFLRALVVVAVASSCRRQDDLSYRLPYAVSARIDAGRAYVSIEVDDVVVRHLPPLSERETGDYANIAEQIDLTPWVEDGGSEVVFFVEAADGSGLQHRRIRLKRRDLRSHETTELLVSDGRDLGRVVQATSLGPTPGGPCEPISTAKREEVVQRVLQYHRALATRDRAAIEELLPPDDDIAEMGLSLLEGDWALSAEPPDVLPLDPARLRVRYSCLNDAVFVTMDGRPELLHYSVASPGGHASASGTQYSLAFREVRGEWKLVY